MIYLLYGFYDGAIYEEDLLGLFSSEQDAWDASIGLELAYDGYKVKQAPLGELIGDI
jgi:hypothetical protein